MKNAEKTCRYGKWMGSAGLILLCLLILCLGACQPAENLTMPSFEPETIEVPASGSLNFTETATESESTDNDPGAPSTEPPATTPTSPALFSPTDPEPEETTIPQNPYIICIDPGHQAQANTDREPLGPGSDQMKVKVAGGTRGVASGVPEYIVTLQVSLKLKAILEERGYQVIMTRLRHDVDISNSARAYLAAHVGADAFLRIHCNGYGDPSVQGIMTMCQSRWNEWVGEYYEEWYRLSECILQGMLARTGAESMGVRSTDSMTGINWSRVPTTLIEMGFMTNPEEDLKLVDDAYQDLLALGIADGLDAYFGR